MRGIEHEAAWCRQVRSDDRLTRWIRHGRQGPGGRRPGSDCLANAVEVLATLAPTLASRPRRLLPPGHPRITTTPCYRSTGSPRTATGPPDRGPPSLLKPLGRSKELRQRGSQGCHGLSAALFPAPSVIPSQDKADTQAPPRHQWPIQGRVTDISALCNANRFLGLVSQWRATVWASAPSRELRIACPAPTRVGVHEREVTDSCLFLVRRSA
jgi:hypothetical protein